MTEAGPRFAGYSPDLLLLTVDLLGTYVFAVKWAMTAIRANLDLLGLMVLSFATALGGGMIRDLLIGAVPPNSIRDWRYGATAFAGGGTVFFWGEDEDAANFRDEPGSRSVLHPADGGSLESAEGIGTLEGLPSAELRRIVS